MNQTQYDSWVFLQLEPDAVIRTGNHKRYKPVNILSPVAEVLKNKEPEMTGKQKDEFNEEIIKFYKL